MGARRDVDEEFHRVSGAVPSPAPDRRTLLVLLALTALAGFLRLYHLGQESLWIDEAATWWNATRPTWHDTIFAESNHSPLWWMVSRLFVKAFGDGEFALRLPAALCGIAAVPLTFFLARSVLDPKRAPEGAGWRGIDSGAAPWIACLAAIHPFWIEYSQEARMYSTLLVEALALSIVFLSWLDRRGAARIVLYGVVSVLALYTHPFVVFVLAGHATFFLLERLRTRGTSPAAPWWPLLLAQMAAGLAYLPWALRSATIGARVESQGHFSGWERGLFALWRLLYGPSLATADRPRIDAGLAALLRQEMWVFVVGAVLAALVLFLGVRALRRDAAALSFVSCGAFLPFVVLIPIYSRLLLLHEKYLITVAPFLLILAVVGARAAPRAWKPYTMAALIGMIALGAVAYVAPGAPGIDRLVVHGHPRGKEQWREARSWVAGRADSASVVALYPSYLMTVWEYYDRHRLTTAGIERNPASSLAPAGEVPRWASAQRILLVSAGTRTEERDLVAREVARWAASDTVSTTRGGWVEGHLFPRQWGVWTYEFVRGRPPARLPE
jgi:uncharacterized membrane protein